MPFKLDGSDAPANVQKLPRKKRRAWIRIWNSTFARCQSEGGKECEASAFKMANGTVRPSPQ
jgi:hypothetical protein